jgi:hypothetical protein
MIYANTGAEKLQPTAGARAFDDRGLEFGCFAELFGDRRCERENGLGSDDADLVAGLRRAGYGNADRGREKH